MNEMMKYYERFIRDTIKFSRNVIYVYATDEIDKDFLVSRYKRYNTEITITDYKNSYMLIVDCKEAKTNFIKNIFYYISDTIYDIVEFIGNVLVS